MRELFLLTDYKGEYWCAHKHGYEFFDLDRLTGHLAEHGLKLVPRRLSEVDLRSQDYAGQYVLYQSSQDFGLHYKSYIEDVVLGLRLQGAHLIPEPHLLRAHHNKAFLEILRDLSGLPELHNLRSRVFGTYEDFLRHLPELSFPLVLKSAFGDSGRGVALAHTPREARRIARRMSLTPTPRDLWMNAYKTVDSRGRWVPNSYHRGKFIAQPFVPGLDQDWKSIVFGPKYFVSVRPTRPDDFRASGSKGARRYPTELPAGLLDFLERVFSHFGAPFASVDVLHDGQAFYLGEIQFLRFGTGALYRNTHHWTRAGGDGPWTRVDGRRDWEPEFAECVARHIAERHGG